jgi:hypothetical protein
MRLLILSSLILSFVACQQETDPNKKTNYFSKILNKSNSPNGERIFTLGERGNDSTMWVTQVLVSLPGGGGEAYDAVGKNLSIKAYWKGNDTIVIETKRNYKSYQKHEFVQIFSEKVIIEYKEYQVE